MSAMHAPSSPAPSTSEPGPFMLLVLIVGSLFASGAIGLYLWLNNPAVQNGAAFGTPNQMPPGGVTVAAGGPAAGAPLDPALVAQGQQLATQFTCVVCHSADGSAGAGPTWKGLFGSQVPLDNGQSVAADEAYIRESILQPDAKTHKGFAKGVMAATVAPVEAQIQSGKNLDALIAYIKSLK